MKLDTLLSIVILFSTCLSCHSKKSDYAFIPKIAKTVPADYYDAADTNFTIHLDTLFYKKKLFTGFRFTLNDQGDTTELGSYFNGVEEGLQQKWYAKGKRQETRFYINGKKERNQRGWWPNGQIKFDFNTYNDEYEGAFREWIENGLLIKQFHYEHGYEKGSQRLWWTDGTVRANYVIKDGKKYGLLGLKICTNPYDSVTKK